MKNKLTNIYIFFSKAGVNVKCLHPIKLYLLIITVSGHGHGIDLICNYSAQEKTGVLLQLENKAGKVSGTVRMSLPEISL